MSGNLLKCYLDKLYMSFCVLILLTEALISSSLSPLTQKVVALTAKMKTLEEDKNHLTINLRRAEEEVCMLLQIMIHVRGLFFQVVVLELDVCTFRWMLCLKKTTSWMRRIKGWWSNAIGKNIVAQVEAVLLERYMNNGVNIFGVWLYLFMYWWFYFLVCLPVSGETKMQAQDV